MKLSEIWNARETFNRLALLRKPPKVAYRLMKYERKLSAELTLCEAQRSKCVCEVAGVDVGSIEAEQVTLMPGTAEFNAFLDRFNEFLDGESDLKPLELEMDALVDALDAESGNVLSEVDLALLEPFFGTSPDLMLVPNDDKGEELPAN